MVHFCVYAHTCSNACICVGKYVGMCVHAFMHVLVCACVYTHVYVRFNTDDAILSQSAELLTRRCWAKGFDSSDRHNPPWKTKAILFCIYSTGPGHSRQFCCPYLETFCPTPILSIPFSCVYATFPLETGLWLYDLMLCTGCWLLWGLRELSEHRHCIPMPSSFPSYRPSGGHSITWCFYLFLRKPPSHCVEWPY